ncbi:non-ribosomal peptide synthetase [Streptomyces sp. FxanaA7]|uniref:non-ribosomal peptide synthetase n=1 Tax=Streptomyces sp. FxanaA7 TaxID=1265492 RepID=UPI0005F038B5|nr:non-ribosomal peptide synthetase [Streptomyces sp. FxanaA7]
MNDIEDIYPLSPAQEGMLFHTLTSAEHGLYVETTTFRILGDLDLQALTAAWETVVARHAVLRTAFVHERISAPRQVVLPEAAVDIDVLDLSDRDEAARTEEAAAELARRRGKPFDLTRPPLMRLLVLRLQPTEHMVVWTYHHMILDGWSAALLMAEVSAELGRAGGGAGTPPPAFREYISWLRRRDAEQDRAFWTDYLAGYREPAVFTLPGVRPGAKPSGSFRTVRATLPATATARLRALSAACSATLGSLVEAAWAGTVARYSGRDDVVVGVTVSGRPPRERADDMIGMFINTIPVRARVERDLPADEWLAHHAASRHPVLGHQHTPLTDVQRWAGTEHGARLLDTVVVFENYPDASEAVLADGALRICDVGYETRTNYIATLVVRSADDLSLQLVVDSAVFGEGQAERVLAHLIAVLERFADRPGMPVHDLLAVPRETRALLLDRWNGSDVDRAVPRALLDGLTDAAVAARPDHPAVVADDATYTYRELSDRAEALALRLAGFGVGPGDRVGVCLDRGADLVTALLAVARTGAAFVPLDPAHPAERTAYILRDSAPTLVLTDGSGDLTPVGWDGKVLDLSQEELDPAAGAGPSLPGATPDGLAYVIYTSGSTGRPKGVAISHRALANLVDSLARRHPGLGAEDRFLALTTLTFDTSLAELLVPLAVGASVHVGRRSLGLSGRELDDYVTREGITALQATPSRYRVLLESGWQGSGGPRLYSCGEAFPPDLVEPLVKRGRTVWNMYGPTETTVYSSVEEIHAETTRVTVGRPISNTALRVLDAHGAPVPIGCVGELWIGGDGVAEGYWNQPALTEDRFVADPFAPGSRMFRTGDHARTLPDGRVELLGRMDRQLKLRGYRVEPGEIEQVLMEEPDIEAAAVAVRDDRLVAWTVPADRDAPLAPARLRERLRRILPSYMVPEVMVTVDTLPLTPAGKTDLLALTVPADEPDEPGEPAPAPSEGDGTPDRRSAHVELVARLFQEVLAVPRAEPDDDFFALGGDSLLAMRIATRLKAEFDLDLDIELLFQYSTVRELAEYMAGMPQADVDPPQATAPRVTDSTPDDDQAVRREEHDDRRQRQT